jgi:hypothetical protein
MYAHDPHVLQERFCFGVCAHGLIDNHGLELVGVIPCDGGVARVLLVAIFARGRQHNAIGLEVIHQCSIHVSTGTIVSIITVNNILLRKAMFGFPTKHNGSFGNRYRGKGETGTTSVLISGGIHFASVVNCCIRCGDIV